MPISPIEALVAGLGVLGTGLGAVLGWVVADRSYKTSIKHYELSASTAAADWLRDLRTWASEAIDVLAEAAYHSPKAEREVTPQEEAAVRVRRCRLSALIDRGRLFLPNEEVDALGPDNPPAYRGARHSALNPLIAAERILGKDTELRSFPHQRAALVGVRREFVSLVQAILDPKSFNAQIAKLLHLAAESRQQDLSLGGLLPSPGSIPIGAEGLMDLASRRYDLEHRPKH
jgi:hypothetical protein